MVSSPSPPPTINRIFRPVIPIIIPVTAVCLYTDAVDTRKLTRTRPSRREHSRAKADTPEQMRTRPSKSGRGHVRAEAYTPQQKRTLAKRSDRWQQDKPQSTSVEIAVSASLGDRCPFRHSIVFPSTETKYPLINRLLFPSWRSTVLPNDQNFITIAGITSKFAINA